MRLTTTNNVLIQNGGTFTDSGERLQVTGDVKIKGSGNTTSTTALTVQNSDGNFILSARNDRKIWIFSNNNITGLTVGDTIGSSVGTNISLGEIRFNSNGFIYHSATSGSSSDSGGIIIKSNNTLNPTVNNPKDLAIGSTFAPTSGTGTYVAEMINPVINQTGVANGITRGLYVNPTLTAAADWRSIEWSNNSGWGLYGAGTANNFIAGNLLLGASTPNTGERLQVTGTMKVTGDVTTGPKITLINSGFTWDLHNTGSFSNTDLRFISNGSFISAFWANTAGGGMSIGVGTRNGRFYVRGENSTNTANSIFADNSSGTEIFKVRNDGNVFVSNGNLILGGTTNTTDWLNISASTSAKAQINLESGTAPTSPVNGDIWFDGTDIKIRIGGVTKTFTLV
jgi:hypothetical protein